MAESAALKLVGEFKHLAQAGAKAAEATAVPPLQMAILALTLEIAEGRLRDGEQAQNDCAVLWAEVRRLQAANEALAAEISRLTSAHPVDLSCVPAGVLVDLTAHFGRERASRQTHSHDGAAS